MYQNCLTYPLQVTFDVAWSPKCIDKCCECVDKRCYEYKKIAEASDFVFVMSYDEQSQICGDCIGIANSPYDQTAKGESYETIWDDL